AGGVVVQVVGDGDAEGGAVGHQHHVLVRVAVENLVDGRHHAVAHHALGFAPGGGEIRVAVELPGGAVEKLDIVELDALPAAAGKLHQPGIEVEVETMAVGDGPSGIPGPLQGA